MSHSNDAYTIVIFRGATSAPIRFRIPRRYIKRALVLGICLIIAEAVLLTQYVIRTGEVWELHTLRAEMVGVRQQTTTFSNALNELKRRMLAMKDVNQRLRVMLGIEQPQPGNLLNGQGGGEIPIIGNQSAIIPSSSARRLQTSHWPVPATRKKAAQDPLVYKVQQDIHWLQNQADEQERMLQVLGQAAKERSAQWAALPSIWPVRGWITSRFGPRISPFTNQRAHHNGLDIGAANKTPVKATANGRVRAAGFDSKMGNIVLLDHGYGLQTEYAHLAKILVRHGQRIRRGDVIGLIGSTGRSTGPHLHYMVKMKGRAVDPVPYILN